MKKEEMKDLYEAACTNYVNAFCKKHKLDTPEWYSEIDGTYNIADWYLYFGDIKTDIDEDVKGRLIFQWYEDQMEAHYKNPNSTINYKSYIMGARFDMMPKEF